MTPCSASFSTALSVSSLRHEKEDAKEIRTGFECGVGFKNFNDIQPGDQLVCYTVEKSG